MTWRRAATVPGNFQHARPNERQTHVWRSFERRLLVSRGLMALSDASTEPASPQASHRHCPPIHLRVSKRETVEEIFLLDFFWTCPRFYHKP